jgi:hypothetical protein
MPDGRAERFEIFVTWYLRFNGYFTIPSFVVHAGDDPARISRGAVGNLTEVDTLAVRLPFSREESGIQFQTDKNLVEGAEGRFDVVIAEVKSGEGNSPNPIWRKGETGPVEYLLRFVGWHSDVAKIEEAAKQLSQRYVFEEPSLRIRYIVFAEQPDQVWQDKGVRYITFDNCIRFLSEERGQCWANSGIGRRSMHSQWNPLINRIFQIANDASLDAPQRRERIWGVLDKE